MEAVERVPSIRFLRVTITEDFSWTDKTSAVVRYNNTRYNNAFIF